VLSRRQPKTGAAAAGRKLVLHQRGLLQISVNSLGLAVREQPWTGSCGLALAGCSVPAQGRSTGTQPQSSALSSSHPASPHPRHDPGEPRWGDQMGCCM